jgi:uncharacterized protein YfaS (alpha-2-macroglobulin family)
MTFTLVVRDAKGEEILKRPVTTDAMGGFNGEITLGEKAALGVYSLSLEGQYGGSGSFRVEEYKRPEFEVTVEAPAEPVKLGDKITATLKAKYYFGAPVAGGKLKYKVTRSDYSLNWWPVCRWDWLYGPGFWWPSAKSVWLPGWNDWGVCCPFPRWMPVRSNPPELVADAETTLSDNGEAKIVIDSAVAKALFGDRDSKYEISAEVTDKSRRTITGKGSVIAARRPFKVYCWTTRGYFQPGDTVEANFSAVTADGKPMKGDGAVKLVALKYDDSGKVTEKLLQTWKTELRETASPPLKLNAPERGQYKLVCSITNAQNQTVEGACLLTVAGAGGAPPKDFNFDALEIITDRQYYSPGETASLLIGSSKNDAFTLLFIRPANGTYPEPKFVKLGGKAALERLEILRGDMPNFFVEVLSVFNGTVHTALKEIVVPPEKRVLNVDVVPAKDKCKPGEKTKFKIRVTDIMGNPVPGHLAATVYDKSVEYISGGSNVPEIKAFFWKWLRHFNSQTQWSRSGYSRNVIPKGDPWMETLGVFGHIENTDSLSSGQNAVGAGGAMLRKSKGAPMPAMAPQSMAFGAAKMEMADSLASAAPMEKKSADKEGEANAAPEPADTTAVRTNFADSAYWSGALRADKKGEAEIPLTLPDSATTWKIRVWSLAEGTAVGEGEAYVITTKDLLLRLQSPRFFVETDESVLSAVVHNFTATPKEAKVSIGLEGGQLKCLDEASRKITLPANGPETRVDWRVKAVKEGEATVTMKVSTGDDSDGMQMKFPVLIHGIMKTVPFCGSISAKVSEGASEFKISIPEKCLPETKRLEIRYSPALATAMIDVLPYLIDYPYGCTEQTLNRFLPLAVTADTLKKMGVSLQDIKDKRSNLNPQEIGDDSERAAQWKRYKNPPVFDEKIMNDIIAEGLKRLDFMQLSDGGWGWFSGYGERSEPHTTALVVHGLLTAKKCGAPVTPAALERGIAWLKNYREEQTKRIRNAPSETTPWKDFADNIDALVYEVLSESGDKDGAEMAKYLWRDHLKLSLYGLSLYGLSMSRAGEKDKVGEILELFRQYLVIDDENQTAWLKIPNNDCWWFWYGSEIETHAFYLRLLNDAQPDGDIAPKLVKYLLNNRKHSTYWNSTRDSSYCVEAFADYIIKRGEDKPSLDLEIKFDGKTVKTVSITPENLFTFDNRLVLKTAGLPSGSHSVTISKKGKGPLYWNAYLSYFTLEDFITAAGMEVKVSRKYYKLTPVDKTVQVAGARGQATGIKTEKYKREEIPCPGSVKSGDMIEIELSLESKNDYEHIIIEDMKPSGFEPVELQSGYIPNALGAYVEFRTEKVCFFVRSLARGSHSVSYRMRAETPGSHSALPAKAEAMYAPEIKANSNEMKISTTE